MSPGRRGPLSFLYTEWRAALWRRWLASHLAEATRMAPEPAVTSSAPSSSVPIAPPANDSQEAVAHDTREPLEVPKTSADVLRAAQAVPDARAAQAVPDARPASAADERRNERR